LKARLFVIIFLIMLLAGCSQATQSSNPAWVDELIEKIMNDPVGNPPLSVWRYEYNGQVVYFVPAHCCDISSVVYDKVGNVLCAPDGGIAGDGDGKCPDFFTERSGEMLIWQDARSH
jgi:Domain of unknown function (DUF6970)